MPEYLAPGVYVEEVSYRSKSIEGVSTTTTGFIGPTRYGPIDLEPDIITSLPEFERVYGDGQPLQFVGADGKDAGGRIRNYMWHAARAFFTEGGRRLYVTRVFRPASAANSGRATDLARAPEAGDLKTGLRLTARFPGAFGNMRARLTLRWGPNILGQMNGKPTLGALTAGDVVWLSRGTKLRSVGGAPADSNVAEGAELFVAQRAPGAASGAAAWEFADAHDRYTLRDGQEPNREARVVTLALSVWPPNGPSTVWDDLAFGADHVGPSGMRDGITALFEATPSSAALARTLPVVVTLEGPATGALDLAALLRGLLKGKGAQATTLSTGEFLTAVQQGEPYKSLDTAKLKAAITAAIPVVEDQRFSQADVERARSLPVPAAGDAGGPSVEQRYITALVAAGLTGPDFSEAGNSIDFDLAGGNDGQPPDVAAYEGRADETSPSKTGLRALEDLEDVSIVAAPGASDPWDARAEAIQGLLLAHAAFMRYRIAVLDSGPRMTIAEVRQQRGKIDSTYGALYYPWVRVMDPITREPIHLPPCGFVAGIYARNDIEYAVYKAPANEVVNLAIGFEQLLNKSQQDVLNPEGINCFRFFEGRGYRLWGARTVSSDPEWKYVNLRRYFAYLERSIDRGTQWVVFKPNGERLWADVRRTIEDFLFNEWQNGALLGDKPERAYFVKCDRSTMTQNDLDNGRLVCQVGVAALRPAEFVIFRIGQWTGDRRT
jgi:phage tail sheath protein FI